MLIYMPILYGRRGEQSKVVIMLVWMVHFWIVVWSLGDGGVLMLFCDSVLCCCDVF